jgi:hypothetical protein
VEQAAAERRKLGATLDEIGDKLVRISPPSVTVAARLLECNLISGVYDAAA